MTKVNIIYKNGYPKDKEVLDCSYAKIEGGVLILAFTPKVTDKEEVKFRYIPFDIIEEVTSVSFLKDNKKFRGGGD